MTVEKRQGRRTWSWKLDTAMRPRLLGDGGVGFVDRKTGRVMDIALGKAVIYDSEGRDVTPEGARWSVRTTGRTTTLALALDDSSLALPYTIDPIVYRTTATSNNANAAAPSISVTIPSAVKDGDMLVAWVAIKSGTATITAAGTWTSVLTTTVNSGALLRVATFRKRATSTDGNGSTAYTFNFSASVAAVAGISAWAGVNNTGTVSSAGSTETNNSLTITLPAVTANTLRIGVGGISANNTFPANCSAGAGCVRRATVGSTAAVSGGIYDGFAAGGSTIVTTGTSARRIGQSISVTGDSTVPNASVVTFPAASGNYNNTAWNAGCATNGFCGTASDSQSGIASVAISIRQGTGNYWNGASFASADRGDELNTTMAADDVSWSYTFAGTSFPAEGDYTVRVVSTDNGTNVESPGVSRTFKIDRTVPTSGVLGLNSVTPAGSAYLSGTTVWYRGVETGGGSFRLRNTVTDNAGGSGAGGSRTNALGGTTTGWTHTASTVATPAGGPYDSNTFGWTQNTTSSPTEVVDALDLATNALVLPTLTFSDDSSTNAPTTTFPVDTTVYNTAGWNAGCATGPGDLCGTADDSSKSGVAAVHVSARQGVGNYWNGASFASGTEVWNVATGTTSWSLGFAGANFPADGTYNFRVRTTDNVGNTAIATFSITIDTSAPAAPSALGTTPASPANNNDPQITGTAEAGSTVNVYATADCTGGSVASGTAAAFGGAGLNPPDIADNSTTSYTALATDAAGNQSTCSAATSYVEDSVAPSAPSGLATTPASPANNNDPRLSGTAEAGSTVNVYATADCTGGSVASGTAAAFGGAGLNPPDIADNSNTSYTARATDAAGNQSSCSSAVSYVEDSTNPSSTVTFPTAGGAYRDGTWSNPAGTASDAGGSGLDRVEISIKRVSDDQYWNGTAFADGTENWRTATGTASWSLTFPASNFPADGDYVFRVRALDNASNTEAASSRTVTIDNAAPNTSITAQPNDPTNATGASFSFTASEGGSTFECRLDGGSWSACTSPKSYTGLTQGSHTFDVRATDAAGNTDGSPASFTWTLDTTDPSSAITFPAAGPYNNAGWSAFSGTASDAGGAGLDKVEVSIKRVSDDQYWNGTAFADGTENWRLAAGTAGWSLAFAAGNFPADGNYTVRARATDLATNVQGTPASQTFTIDNTAPNTAIDSSPADPSNSTGPSFTFSATEGGSTFECRLDGGSWSACTSPKSYGGLTQGSHTFDVRATDAAGNTGRFGSVVHLDARHDRPERRVRVPGRGRVLQPGRLERLRRHRLGRRRRSAAERRDLDQARLRRPVLERHRLRRRHRELAARRRRGVVVALLPGRELQRRGRLHRPPALDRHRRQRGGPGVPRLLGRHERAEHDDHGAAERPDERDRRLLLLHRLRGRLDVRVPARRRLLERLHLAEELHRPHAGLAHLRRPRDRRRRQHGRLARLVHLDARHDRPIVGDHVPRRGPATTTQAGARSAAPPRTRAAQGSTRSRSRSSASPTTNTGTAPPSPTAPKTGARRRHRRLVARLRRRQLPRRRQLHRPRPRHRPRNQRPGHPRLADLHDRQCRAEHDDHRAAERPDERDRRLLLLHLLGRRLDVRVPARRRRLGLLHLAQDLHRPERRLAHVRGSRDRRRRQHRREPRQLHLDDRHRRAEHHDHRAAERPDERDGASFSFTSSEGGSTFECRTDAGLWSACASAESLSGLAAGSHTFDVRATDAAGNTDGSPASFTWTIDTAAPNTTITAQPSDPSNSANADFSFTSSEGGSTFECRLDGGSWSACTSPKSHSGLSDGSHTFEVRATDAAGNTDASPASFTWTIDTAAPNTTITAQPSDPDNSAAPDFSFTASEGGSTFACQLDGGGWSACVSPKSYTGLSDGSHTFEVRATDAAGNTDGSPASFTWTIDSGAPSSTASFPVNTASYNIAGWNAGCSPSGICGTASDGGSGLDRVEVSLQRSSDSLYWNGSSFASASEDWRNAGGASWNLAFAAAAFPAEGSYTIRVRALDLAGNVEAPASRTFTVDTTPPDTSVDSGPANPTNDQDPDFTFSGGPGSVTFECRLDGGSWGACTSPEGLHGARGRLAHLRRARAGRRRELRPDACDADLDDRPDRPELGDRLPGERRLLQRRRLEQPVRHRLGRRRPRPRRGLAPARVRLPLLERHGVRGRLRELAHGDRHRHVVACVRGRRTSRPTATTRSASARSTPPATSRRASSRTFTVDTVPPETTIDTSPATPISSTNASLHLLGRPAGLQLRVPHRRRRVGRVHEPAELHVARRGLAHLRGPGDRRRRKRRPLPRLPHLVRRHGSAGRDDGRPRPVPQGHGQPELHLDRHRRQRRRHRRLRALARRRGHVD